MSNFITDIFRNSILLDSNFSNNNGGNKCHNPCCAKCNVKN